MNIRIFFNLSAGLVLSSFAISQVYAQPAYPPTGQSAPSATAASGASPLDFRSAFEGYKPYTEEKILDWKLANDNVGKIGGWREYAREASQPDSAAAPAATPAKTNPATDRKAGSAKP